MESLEEKYKIAMKTRDFFFHLYDEESNPLRQAFYKMRFLKAKKRADKFRKKLLSED